MHSLAACHAKPRTTVLFCVFLLTLRCAVVGYPIGFKVPYFTMRARYHRAAPTEDLNKVCEVKMMVPPVPQRSGGRAIR